MCSSRSPFGLLVILQTMAIMAEAQRQELDTLCLSRNEPLEEAEEEWLTT